jgi:hypothetical protein
MHRKSVTFNFEEFGGFFTSRQGNVFLGTLPDPV